MNALGSVPVKGVPDPIEVFEATGAGTVRTRLQAAARRGLTKGHERRRETAADARSRASRYITKHYIDTA